MEPVVFGLHTAEVKKWITQKEANVVKAFFGVNPSDPLTEQMYFYPYGIIFWIEEVRGHKPRFYLRARINFARATGFGNYLLMPYTVVNIRKAITAFNKILKLLSLSPENAAFADWTVERFDSAFDIQEPYKSLMIQLLNYSLDLSNGRKKCTIDNIKGKAPEELLYQTVRFGNYSFTYSIYDKEQELLDKGKILTEEEKLEIHNTIRAERQNHPDAVKKLLPSRSIKDLANAKVRDNILRIMIDELSMFFGNGDYYSWKAIKEQFSDHATQISPIIPIMQRITENSLMRERTAYTKEVAEVFTSLGISPVGIQGPLARRYGVNRIDGLYTRITAFYPRPKDKRAYNPFPVPHIGADGRYRANITLYRAQSPKQNFSIAGKTLADYEMKVLRKLREVCLINRFSKSTDSEAYNKSFDSIMRFRKTVKTKEVKQEIDSFIKAFEVSDAIKNMPEQEE